MDGTKETLNSNHSVRQGKWTESIAVGSPSFLELIKSKLNSKARGRKMIESGHGSHELREEQSVYGSGIVANERAVHDEHKKNHYSWM